MDSIGNLTALGVIWIVVHKLQVLFAADRKLCDTTQRGFQVLRAKQWDGEGHAEVTSLINSLQETPRYKKSIVERAEIERQLEGCKELLVAYQRSMRAKDAEYIRLQREKSLHESANQRAQKSLVEAWTEDLKDTDESVYWMMSFPPSEVGKDFREIEYDETLQALDQIVKQTGRLYAEILGILSPDVLKEPIDSEAEMQLEYENMSEKLAKFKENPRSLETKPEVAIYNVYPPFKTFVVNCNSTFRREVLTATVIEEVLKQDPQKMAAEGSMVSLGFIDWLIDQLGIFKKDAKTNTYCDVKIWGSIIPDLTMGINYVAEKYRSKAAENLSKLLEAKRDRSSLGVHQAKMEFKRLRKKFLEEYYAVRVAVRDSRLCTDVAVRMENLIHNAPLPQWITKA